MGIFFNNFCLHALSVIDTRIHSKYSELLVIGQRVRSYSYVDLQEKIKLCSEYVALKLSWATRNPLENTKIFPGKQLAVPVR
jgi:hypothetical protein